MSPNIADTALTVPPWINFVGFGGNSLNPVEYDALISLGASFNSDTNNPYSTFSSLWLTGLQSVWFSPDAEAQSLRSLAFDGCYLTALTALGPSGMTGATAQNVSLTFTDCSPFPSTRFWGMNVNWTGANTQIERILIYTDASKNASHTFTSVGQLTNVVTGGLLGGTVALTLQNTNCSPANNNVFGEGGVNTVLTMQNQEYPYYNINKTAPVISNWKQGALGYDLIGSSGNSTIWGGASGNSSPPLSMQEAINRLAQTLSGIVGNKL
jgi:hypothetical protein